MKTILLRTAIFAIVAVLAWIYGTRPFSQLFDRAFTVKVGSLPTRPISYNRGRLEIAGKGMELPDSSLPIADFISDGNELSFTVERSYLWWPNPFEMNFMTGATPSRKRYIYFRLLSKRASGDRLEIVWRFEQWLYTGNQWGGEMNVSDSNAPIRIVRTSGNMQ